MGREPSAFPPEVGNLYRRARGPLIHCPVYLTELRRGGQADLNF